MGLPQFGIPVFYVVMMGRSFLFSSWDSDFFADSPLHQCLYSNFYIPVLRVKMSQFITMTPKGMFLATDLVPLVKFLLYKHP